MRRGDTDSPAAGVSNWSADGARISLATILWGAACVVVGMAAGVLVARGFGAEGGVALGASPVMQGVSGWLVGGAAMLGAVGCCAVASRNAARRRRELLRSERRFLDFAGIASEWYWETDSRHRFVAFWGRPDAARLGALSDVLGRTRWELVAPELWTPELDEHVRVLERHESFTDFRLSRYGTDGKILHFLVSGKPIFDDDGSFMGYRGVSTDVTTEQQTLESRAETRRLLNVALESLSDAFIVTDQEDSIVLFNSKAEDFLIAGDRTFGIGDRFADWSRARVKAGLIAEAVGREEEWLRDRLASRGDTSGGINVVQLSDGRWLRLNERRMPDGGIATIISDITEIKNAEYEARQAREVLAQALDSINEGFLLWDEEDRCVLWNRRCSDWLPQLRETLDVGVTYEDMVRRRVERGLIHEALGDPETWIRERMIRHRNPDGPFEVEISPGQWLRVHEHRTAGGGTVGVWTDISAFKAQSSALEEKSALLETTMAHIDQGICVYGADLRLIAWNDRFVEILDLPPHAAVEGAHYESFIGTLAERGDFGDDEVDETMAALLEEARQPERLFYEWHRRNGLVVEVQSNPMPGGGFVATATDVTRSKRIESALRSREAQLREIVETAPMPVIVIGLEDQRIRFVNPHGAAVFGLDRETLGTWRIDDLYWDAADIKEIREEMAASGGNLRNRPVRIRRGDGARRWVEVSAQLGRFDGERSIIATVVDVTERREAEERIRDLAFMDALTALPNRRMFHDHLQHILAHAGREHRRVAIHYIDLDQFKHVNDSLGHDAGDELLKQAAARLLKCVRDADVLARLGGDEFAIIQVGVERSEAAATLASRIIESFSRPFQVEDHSVHAGASVGITLFPDDSTVSGELLRNADLALYKAKAEGRSIYAFYSPALGEHVRRRVDLIANLHAALNGDLLSLRFQPIIDLKTGRLMQMEALLRWEDPHHGSIPPSEFIPIAESSGLIIPIGRWVLKRVCRQLREWLDAGLAPVPVAINVSPREMHDREFVAHVIEALRELDLSAALLEIEITEGTLVEDVEGTIAVMQALKAVGVSFAIDDFGVGHSSLGYLKRLPISTLKIDQSFVVDIERDKDDTAIVEAVIGLAATLGLRVVAEGVETESQRAFLHARGCNAIQGYLIARPLLPDDAAGMLAEAAALSSSGR